MPNDKDQLDQFMNEYKSIRILMEEQIYDRVKVFYFSVYFAAMKCNLVSNDKPKPKIKC